MSLAQSIAHSIAVLAIRLDQTLNPHGARGRIEVGDTMQILVTDHTKGPPAMRLVSQFLVMPGAVVEWGGPPPRKPRTPQKRKPKGGPNAKV